MNSGTTIPPRVSVILPTLNAAGVLEPCLRSIRQQDYPPAQVEILVADGGSTDATRELAQRHGAIIIENPLRIAEQGKRLALGRITGDYVLFLDADNALSHPDIISRALRALADQPEALGLESYYLAAADMSSFCIYLTQTLHISDPIAWMMSVRPVRGAVKDGVETWTFPEGSLAYPLGANGFFYRRATLESVQASEDFEDSRIALRIAQSGKKTWLRLTGRGVHHYFVKGIWDFIKKRRRQAFHFLSLRGKSELSWTNMQPCVSPFVACLYCATLIGPLFHTVTGLVRTGDWHWLWHPLACLASVFGLAWGVLTFYTKPKTADAEAGLQPKQKI